MAITNNNIKTPNNVGGMFGYNFYNSSIANNEKLTLEQKQKKIDFNNNIGQIAMMAQGLGSLIEGYAASRQDTTPLEQRVGLYDLGGQLMGGMQVGMGALQLGANAFNQSKIANTKQLKEQIRDFGTKQSTAMSFDDLAKEYDQFSALKHISARDLRGNSYLQDGANMLTSAGSGAATGAMFGPIGAGIGAVVGGLTSFLGSNRGRHKAKEEETKINKLSDWANTSRQSILGYRGGEIAESNFLDMMRNYGTEDEEVNVQAYGGNLFKYGGGSRIAKRHQRSTADRDKLISFLTGGLAGLSSSNKKSKSGSFGGGKTGSGGATSKPSSKTIEYEVNDTTIVPPIYRDFNTAFDNARERGDSVFIFNNKPYTTELGEGDHSAGYNRFEVLVPADTIVDTMKKKKTVDNSWAMGGPMFTQGGIWSNDLTYINNGGTHEQNPIEGVPMGVAPDGTPNLVEEGEVIWNDYVFSNRLKLPKRLLDKYKLGGKLTFAEAVDALTKQSKEMPNDPITKATNDVILSELQNEQELVRMNRQKNKLKKQEGIMPMVAAHGGKLGMLFGGDGDYSQFLLNPYLGFTDFVNNLTTDQANTMLNNQYQYYIQADENEKKSNRYKAVEKFYKENPSYHSPNITINAEQLKGLQTALLGKKQMPIFDSNLKYAPIGINALSTLYNIASPIDYSEANAYSSIAGNVKSNYISFSPIQNTLRYRPVDPTIGLNQAAASNAATRRAMTELTTNPLAARAGILANEYAYQLGIGELIRKAQEENWSRRKEVAQEQRTVDAFNSAGRREVATQNQAEDAAVRALQTNYTAQAAKARAAAKQAKATAIGSGLTTLANNFYNLGVQRDNSGALQWLLNNDYL